MSQEQLNDASIVDLADRSRFTAEMAHAIAHRGDTDIAVVAIDIKRFRLFNIWYGKEAGDRVLLSIADYLVKLRDTKGYQAGYLGDDDFVLYVPNDQSEIINVWRELQACVDQIKTNLKFEVFLGVCACSEDPAADPFTLYNYARVALAEESPLENSTIRYFDRARLDELENFHEIMAEVNRAFDNDEFVVYMQPKVNSMSQRIVGAEALVRWNHPTRGILTPDVFMATLRQNGLESQLDAHVWHKTIETLSAWIKEGKNIVPVSVNVTLDDIKSMDVVSTITNLLDYYHVDPHYLDVEITESIMARNKDYVIEVANELRAQGISIQMDDFGSGYSSLGLLKDMPVDVLKLDMSLIDFRQDNYKRGMSVLDAIASMAAHIGLPLVVEGVQTQSQVYVLQALDSFYVQGYFFRRPLPVSEMEELLAAPGTPAFWDIKSDYAQRSQTELGNLHVDDTSALTLRSFRIYADNLLFNSIINLETATIHISKVSDLIARDYMRGIEDLPTYTATLVEHKIIHPDDTARFLHFLNVETLRKRLYKDAKPISFRFRELINDQYRWITLELIPATNVSPAEPWVALSLREDSLAEQLIGELDRAYTHDVLTGLLNRNAFEKDLVELQLSESIEPYVVAYIDVVGLHEVNNYTGHAAGDRMLQAVADSAKISFVGQKAYRIGGDEFIVLAKGYDLARAQAGIERMRKRLSKQSYEISVGLAHTENSFNLNNAYMEAEAAMRAEKQRFYIEGGAIAERNKLNEQLEAIITEKEDAERFLDTFMPADTDVLIVNLTDGFARAVVAADHVRAWFEQCNNDFTAVLKMYCDSYVSGENQKRFAELLNYKKLQSDLLVSGKIEKSFTRNDGVSFIVWIVPYGNKDTVSDQTIWVFSRKGSHVAPAR